MQQNTWQLWLLSRLFKRWTKLCIMAVAALVVFVYAFSRIRSAYSYNSQDTQSYDSRSNIHNSEYYLPQQLIHYPNDTLEPRLTFKLPSVCCNALCMADYNKYLHRQDLLPIPAIRHIIWRNETVSEHMAEHLRSWVRIHPNWTYVLWRDQDLEVFVATYFPTFLQKFKSLPQQIMRVDAVRYLLLFKYGGVYADLDYTLVKSLEEFRHFHAVVTREPENHAFPFLPLAWPLKPLANSAFMMSAPGHMLFHYAIEKLKSRAALTTAVYYAGPFGMTSIMEDYQSHFPIVKHAMESVYMPPSFSFYPYVNNRLNTSNSYFLPNRISNARATCRSMMSSKDAKMMKMKLIKNLTDYCSDVNNMDPITDKSQPVYAIHDLKKTGDFYQGRGVQFYVEKPLDMRTVIRNLNISVDIF